MKNPPEVPNKTEIVFIDGDRVFDYEHGWGIVETINDPHVFTVKFKDAQLLYNQRGAYATLFSSKPRLSFNEYDLIHGGLTQLRMTCF
jgi:hypothetical protein